MERQVISLYDAGVLNKETLNALMEPFRNTDIDHGGSCNLGAKDGENADNIICFVMEPKKYREATENFMPDPEEPDWNERLYDLYNKITRREWGLW